MCLAVPGKIIEIREGEALSPTGRVATVDFQGSRMDVSLAFADAAGPGDWVLVHAGFALSILDEAEAIEIWKYLEEANLAEMPAELAERADESES